MTTPTPTVNPTPTPTSGGTWAYPVNYVQGDTVIYNGKTWTCVFAHQSQADWYPGAPGIWFWE